MWTRGESVVVTVLQNIQYSLLKQERVLAIIRTKCISAAYIWKRIHRVV